MHRPANPARNHIADIRTWIESLKLWILGAIACVADRTGSRELRLWVQRETRAARRCAKGLIFLMAFAQIDAPRRHKPNGRPLRAPRGFRSQRRRNNALRHFLRGVKLRTLGDIKAALDTIDAVAARVARRVRWRARYAGFVLCFAPRVSVVPLCADHCVEAADTS